MRFDKKVYFQKVAAGAYNDETGDYEEDVVEEEKVMADVTDTSTATMNIVYGKIRQGSKTVRLQNHYDKPFDYIRIKGRKYRVDYSRRLSTKHAFIVSEVQ